MDSELSSPLPEHVALAALESGLPREKGCKARITVRITRLAIRQLDPGNLEGSAKALVDSLCDSGLIPDDDAASIDLQVNQVKVKHRRHQGTLLELIYP